jgi:glycosyltransferase involved in cell wall biosynthesis
MENVFFTFIGSESNPYFKELSKKTKALGIENRVALLQGVSRALTESAIQACDIALMTSKSEMQPLFLLEAMSASKPWISTNVGSVRELDGGIISQNHSSALASNLFKLLQNIELRNQLGKKGSAQWAAEFSTAKVYDRWQELLLAAVTI